jgi:hypothetical protein
MGDICKANNISAISAISAGLKKILLDLGDFCPEGALLY